MTTSPEQQKDLYRHLLLTRLLEERMVSLYRQGKMTGGLFRCLGQEATAVGTAFALEEGDLLVRSSAIWAQPWFVAPDPSTSSGR
jgi:TPP-dependent pyruvate/acetoin dehydrogenase alpha subunit